jgi:hypothetical protein
MTNYQGGDRARCHRKPGQHPSRIAEDTRKAILDEELEQAWSRSFFDSKLLQGPTPQFRNYLFQKPFKARLLSLPRTFQSFSGDLQGQLAVLPDKTIRFVLYSFGTQCKPPR